MSAVLDDSLLDDPRRLVAADGDAGGLLRAAAAAGAQVRATVEAARESGLRDSVGGRPRALVFVTRPGVGPAATKVLTALVATTSPVPVVVADAVPSWVGPLDVVVAHSDDAGDVVLAESIGRAGRFGARLVLTVPESGPVAAAAAGQAVLLPPRMPVPPGFGFARALAAGLLVLDVLGLHRTDVTALADELDKEAERDHPMHESFVNPAKSLALRVADRSPLLWGLDHVGTAVADHAAGVLSGYAGLVCDVAAYPQALTRPALHRAAVQATSPRSLFADPDEDTDTDLPPLRVLLLGAATGPVADAVRRAATEALPGADLVVPEAETSADEAVRAAVLALRFEMAALYLGLAAGTLGGPGLFAPVNL